MDENNLDKNNLEENKLLPIVSKCCDNKISEPSFSKDELSKEQVESMENCKKHNDNHEKPFSAAKHFPGFYYARKMHMDNLLHQPLPDTMAIRKLQINRKEPGQDLDVKPYSLPWNRPENVPLERPLTCSKIPKVNSKLDKFNPLRPATSGGEKKILKNMTPMDLAICWDFRTIDPKDEPKRPKHIDGSNGCLAPAVFSMVHSPKHIVNIPETGRSNAIFSQNILPDHMVDEKVVPSFEKDMSKNKHKESCDVPKCSQHDKYEKHNRLKDYKHYKNGNKDEKNGIEPHTKMKTEKRSGSCDGIHGCGTPEGSNSPINSRNKLQKENIKHKSHETRKSYDNLSNNDGSFESFIKKKNCHSSPNISKCNSHDSNSIGSLTKYRVPTSKTKRDCIACNDKNNNSDEINCGKSNSTNCSEIKSSSNSSKNSLKIPKMKDPYSKKSYGIPTLAPPFSRWKEGNGYPEHWRLASIYQHAYKPPDNRRCPLLHSVYK